MSAPSVLNQSMRVESKIEMYALYHRGLFGNRLQTWKTLGAFYDSGFRGKVVLRYSGPQGGAWAAYEVEPEDVAGIVREWVGQGANPNLISLNESAPDSELVLQGEVMRSQEYLSVRYSRLKAPMRVGLSKALEHCGGLLAVLLLKGAMDPSSWDDLQGLFDTYHEAVVEFSVWSRDVGVCPRRNTVFWEVRDY